MRSRLAALLAVLLLAAPAGGAEKFFRTIIGTPLTVSTAGGAQLIAIPGALADDASQGYLVVRTTNVVATPTLTYGIGIRTSLGVGGIIVVCSGGITTATTTTMSFGNQGTAAGSVTTACDFPLPQNAYLFLQVGGAGASIDVEAEIHGAGDAS